MNLIYRNFFKKKGTKIYLTIFIALGITFSFLFISQKYLITKGNEAYQNSYLYIISKDNIDFKKDKNIKNYNKALSIDCDNFLTNVFITDTQPVFKIEGFNTKQCNIENYTIEYFSDMAINLINNSKIYNFLENDQNEYFYFISLKDWFRKDETVKYLASKYHTEVGIETHKIDSVEYKDIIFIFDVFIKIIEILFVILCLISIFNIIIDEKKNNFLYYVLGYSKIKIIEITFKKILLIIIIPLILIISSLIITFLM